MEIRGVAGYFNDMRIDRSTVPEHFHFWELADGDSDGTPCRYRPGILVNFYGTFITAGELPVDDQKYAEGYINSDDEWGYTEGGSITFENDGTGERSAVMAEAITKPMTTVMNVSFRFAVSKKVIADNPAEGVKLPKKVKKKAFHTRKIDTQKTLTLEQVDLLLEKSKDTPIHMQELSLVAL